MLKKIYISSLVLILVVSTTGLTYTYHLCKMMGESDAVVCEMEHVRVQHSCCMDENDGGPNISAYSPDCCEFQTIENRISDEFISFNSDKNFGTSLSFTPVAVFTLANNFDRNSLDFHPNNNSPPGRNSNIFILNSTFLI
ncbi:MAG: hypothetical protein PVF17_04925 [Ignavibacteria bacterium]|jgi:hypothetical protein